MSKKFTIIGVVLILVAIAALVVLGVWLGSAISGSSESGPSKYSVVSLASGELYFGKLSWFPTPRLSKVWMVQRQVDEKNQVQLSLAQFDKAFWSPVDEIYLNPKEILWWSRLRNDSQVAKAIDNPALLQQQQQQQQQGGQPQSSNSDFKGPSTQPPANK